MPDQRVLSDRFKAAIKTALAMVLAYGWFAASCIVNQPVRLWGPCPARKNSRDIPNPAHQISVIRRRTLKRLQVNEPGSCLTSPMRGRSDEEGQSICTGSLWLVSGSLGLSHQPT